MAERLISLKEEEKRAEEASETRTAVGEFLVAARSLAIRQGCDGSATIEDFNNPLVLDLLQAVASGSIEYTPGIAKGLVDRITGAYRAFQEDYGSTKGVKR